jgi:hypothetical protein
MFNTYAMVKKVEYRSYNSNDIIANTMKAITNHFAASIDIPATPCIPTTAATIARIKNTMAKYSRSGIVDPPIRREQIIIIQEDTYDFPLGSS